MKLRITVFLSLLAFLSLATVAQDRQTPVLDRFVPRDATFVLLVDDVPRFLDSWSDSPLGLVWDDPKVKEFFAPLREELELDRLEELTRENTGFSLTEIVDGLTGGLAVVVGELDLDSESDNPAPIAILAEIGDNLELFTSLLTRDLEHKRKMLEPGEQIREIEEEFRGQTLHVRQQLTGESVEEQDVWAVVDGLLLFGEPKALVQEFVASLAEGGSKVSLAEFEPYKRARQRSSGADLFGWVNIEQLVTPLVAAFEGEAPDEGEAEGLFGLTASSVVNALGLDSLQAFYVATRISRKSTFLDLGVLYDQAGGLVDVIAYGPGPVERVSFIPPEAVAASVSNFSVPEAWQAVKGILGGINPGLPAMMQLYLGQISGDTGIDLEKSLVGSLGDRVVTAGFLRPPDQPGEETSLDDLQSVFGIAVTDRQSLEMALETLKSFVGGGSELFEQREYRDRTIFVSNEELPEAMTTSASPHLAYALTDEWFFVSLGGAEPIETVLGAISSRGRSLWDRRDVKKALESVPQNASAILYSDLATLTASLFKSLTALEALTEDEDGKPSLVNAESLPDAAMLKRYLGIGIGAVEKTDKGLFGSLKIFPPER